tara:strand:+ start:388 stop:1110 length:723 start_codon:yes stop_codon:yes gene_type:complete
MDIIRTPSPNFDSREGQSIDMLVLHYTGMQSGEAALQRLCEAEASVSAHWLVEEDGRIFQLVDEEQRAWHAGVSAWRGHTNVNARSVGIEIVNPGHEFGYRAFPPVQTDAVLKLAQAIVARHAIAPRNVVGHSDVAPTRKQDPGELFPWAAFAKQGVGLWPTELLPPHAAETEGAQVAELQADLGKLGYGLPVSGEWDALTRDVIAAFQRHWRPEHVDGEWDAVCSQRLASLLHQLSDEV